MVQCGRWVLHNDYKFKLIFILVIIFSQIDYIVSQINDWLEHAWLLWAHLVKIYPQAHCTNRYLNSSSITPGLPLESRSLSKSDWPLQPASCKDLAWVCCGASTGGMISFALMSLSYKQIYNLVELTLSAYLTLHKFSAIFSQCLKRWTLLPCSL